MIFKYLQCLLIIQFYSSQVLTLNVNDYKFPPNFIFGAATSAYQVEGAWNVSDKGESIWDRFCHTKNLIEDGSTGDIAADSYHKWERDIEMTKELNLDYYRFSISWTRILPDGFAHYKSADGANYYNNLINGLLKNGIKPIVTIYHFDLPQNIQDLGGWFNPLITDWFADYARTLFTLYADRVPIWITFNEAVFICEASYIRPELSLNVIDENQSMYLCNKHILIAHAKAWRIYDEIFKPLYHGKVSITNHVVNFKSQEQETSLLAMEYFCGRYLNPIFSKEGGWPPMLEAVMMNNSRASGYLRSKLIPFTEEEKKLIRGTYDFLGMNHYYEMTIRQAKRGENLGISPYIVSDLRLILENVPEDSISPAQNYSYNPTSIREALNYIKRNFGDVEILITENGYGSRNDTLNDVQRVELFRNNLEQVSIALEEDKVNVTGFFAWSLMDNFEWTYGYTSKFGLYHVDFNSPERTRTPRASARYFRHVISNRTFDVLP